MTDFDKRVAIVTGAASGIGRATTLRLVTDGFHVLAVDRDHDSLESLAAVPQVEPYCMDLTDSDAATRIVAACRSAHGQIDTLINVAGIATAQSAHAMTDDQWDNALSINLTSAFRLCREVIPELRQSRGSVVNVSSTLALLGAPMNAGYAASKSALIGLTRQMAADYGPDGIRVNAVAPGIVSSPMTEEKLHSDENFHRRSVGITPLGRPGTTDEVAAAIAFLVGPDSSYINGHVLVVDGGMSTTFYRP